MAVKFSSFLKSLRLRANYGLRQFADLIGEAPSNYANVESGLRNPWRKVEKLRLVASTLGLQEGSRDWDEFFLAAQRHAVLPPDMQHLLERPMIPVLLRTVDELKLSEDELRQLVATLQKKKRRGNVK